jgi:hypothetical protein
MASMASKSVLQHKTSPGPGYATGSQSPPLFLVREAIPEYSPTPDHGSMRGTAGSIPDPLTDADALEELEEEVVTLAAHIHAATHRLLVLIAEFDRRRGWELGGHRSPAHWLSFRTGIDLGAAREKVRAAQALCELPRIGASMARGELSFSKIRALTRVATAENEEDLLELARGVTTAQLERMVRAFRKGSREDEAALERERHRRRGFSVFPDDDGMYLVKGRLTPEVGALLMRAVEAAGDVLFREEMEVGAGSRADSEARATRRRADAVGLLAERAMEAGFEKGQVSGTMAARYQVVLHVETGTLEEEGGAGRSELEDGTRVSAETSRRISCDAGLVRVTHAQGAHHPPAAGPGQASTPADQPSGRASHTSDQPILSVGRRTRTIPPSLRRALEVRDRGCRFPGCGSRFTDAHHVRHWADGGGTSLDNCVLLCHHHHRLVHEGGWRMDWWGPGRPVFFDPRGGTHFEGRWERPAQDAEGSAQPSGRSETAGSAVGRAPRDRLMCAGETLIQENRARGVNPHGWTPSARWKREWDIPDDVMGRAEEGMCGGSRSGSL